MVKTENSYLKIIFTQFKLSKQQFNFLIEESFTESFSLFFSKNQAYT